MNFRNAFDYILARTLEGMNAGKSPEQLAAELSLPSEYAALPYLAEHYGCLEWTVRAIYTAYLGWFDGNPTHLHPLSPETRSKKMTALIGDEQLILTAANKAIEEKDYQWCLELCDLILSGGGDFLKEALQLKASALEKIAEYETSANGRHYYIACAKELALESKNASL